MAKWHTSLWVNILCLGAACSSSLVLEAPSSRIPSSNPTSGEQMQAEQSSPPAASPSPVQPRAIAASKQANLQDTTIVPGERVGPVTKDTSRADLVNLFGEAALEDTQIPVGEGFYESGTVVNGDTEQTFSIIWLDSSQARPALVKDFGTAWRTPEGIRIGMSFTELQPVLGTFKIYGFGWDYGGTVVLEGSHLSDYYGLLIVRMVPDAAAAAAHPDAIQSVQGDRLFASSDPNLPLVKPTVSGMIVYLNPLLE